MGVARRAPSARRTRLRGGTGKRLAVVSIAMLALLTGALPAQASEASTIVEKCAKKNRSAAIARAPTAKRSNSCPRSSSSTPHAPKKSAKAELAAAGAAAKQPPRQARRALPLALTPSAEQKAVQSAHHNGATPVRVGSEPIHPGVVHASIASAVNTLPHSLFAVIALMFAGALVLTIGEVRKRVRSRRDG